MSLWQRLALTFIDKDGSIAIPEVVASCIALVVCGRAIRDCFSDAAFPYVSVCAAIGSLVFGLAAAARARDGLLKPEEEEHR
jgi:hypothetical protein